MITFKRTGDWAAMAKIARTMSARFKHALEVAVMQEAQFLRGLIVKGIASGAPGGRAFSPLSPLTIALRKVLGGAGSKPLIATGALRGSITVTRVASSEPKAFVGVLRNAKSKGGKSLANIAEIHEFGANIRRTEKMNRFLHAMARRAGLGKESMQGGGVASKSGGKAGVIRIPARPFIGPVVEKYARPEDVRRRFYARVAKAMDGDLGQVTGGGFGV